KVKVHQGSAGKAYFGLSVDGISVSESPSWMQTRLKAVGLRPINSIVDISNYVMLELGIPNHIFDRDQIKGDTVIIKSLESDETFTTLDEIERKLISGDTVISDDEKTLVIGGLMGGLNSGVTESTNRIFIEVANWVPSMVRKTSTRLGLRTDSSQRYEKSLDSQLLKRTLLRILELIIELNPEAKVNGSLSYDGENLSDFSPLVMNLDPHRVRTELGHEVSDDQMKSILSSLDFKVEDSSEGFKVTIPSYRSTKDIDCSADLIEEIGRVIGYDNITPSSPMLDITPVNLTPTQKLHRRIKNFCVLSGGFYELQTYPMVGHDLLKKAHWNAKEGHLELINALSKDASLMRDSLIPSHLEVIAKNVKNYSQFKCFEVGRIYKPNDKNFVNEETQLILLQYSETASPFVELSNSVEELFSECSMPAAFVDSHPKFKSEVVDENWEGVHPHEFSNIRLMGKFKGVVFSLHPWLLRQFKIKGHVSLCVLNLGDVEARPAKDKVKYTPLAKFPKSSFDWTVLANKDEPVGNLLKSLSKVKIKNLVETKVADVYQLNDEQKSVTLRATFLDPEKTLDGDFLSGARDQLVSALDKAGYPLKV
ncbi:MAG: phenylalanine--tRNA ligase subunit beta, partial [Bacteriovoracaceae bacterium]